MSFLHSRVLESPVSAGARPQGRAGPFLLLCRGNPCPPHAGRPLPHPPSPQSPSYPWDLLTRCPQQVLRVPHRTPGNPGSPGGGKGPLPPPRCVLPSGRWASSGGTPAPMNSHVPVAPGACRASRPVPRLALEWAHCHVPTPVPARARLRLPPPTGAGGNCSSRARHGGDGFSPACCSSRRGSGRCLPSQDGPRACGQLGWRPGLWPALSFLGLIFSRRRWGAVEAGGEGGGGGLSADM